VKKGNLPSGGGMAAMPGGSMPGMASMGPGAMGAMGGAAKPAAKPEPAMAGAGHSGHGGN
jgi:hypothetical protein